MNKIISFSLWGSDQMYLSGAIRNAELAKNIYPDWICRFYVDKNLDNSIKEQLINLGAQIVEKDRVNTWDGLFWRFEACSDPTVDIVICRDCDSRLNLREKAAVEEWLASDKDFHIMRDHPHHINHRILAGMWGVKTHIVRDMKSSIDAFFQTNQYQPQNKITDQIFLSNIIYPLAINNVMEHQDFNRYGNMKPFPRKRDGYRFVGEIFYQDDTPANHWQDIKRIEG